MQFPQKTPAVVQRALRRYALAQKLCAAMAWAAAALAGAGLIVLACLLLDRFVDCSPAWRVWGCRAALAILAAGAAAIVLVLFRQTPWFALAVRLDQALPKNQDRWATALDMADRTAAGAATGSPERLARLFAETESLTTASGVARLVNRRPLWLAGGALAAALTAFACLQASGVCDLPLLAKRFWHPHGNWPRDGFTTIQIVSVNGRAAPVDIEWVVIPEESVIVLKWADIVWSAIPEESAFSLKIAVNRRAPAWHLPWNAANAPIPVLPRLEIKLPDGRFDAQEFIPTGRDWTAARQSLNADLTFRIRAGDGLTEEFRQPVIPRLKITAFEHAIRFPGYSKMPPVKRQPLTAERLSVLEGSSVDFFVTCNGPAREVRAVFEVFPKKQAAAATVGNPLIGEDGEARRVMPAETGTAPAQRRALKITRSGEDRARFTVMADESGILRVEATGANGLTCREKAVIVEAVADAPPRLTVAGLDPETLIVPGELVGLEYTAEDDLGVSDLVMEWTVAGGAAFEHLTGEEYIQSPQLGQKQVTGSQMIQRMNYYVYAQAPFEFRLVATDTKGQEARSDKFRIQLVRDDFTSRCTDGLNMLKDLADQTQGRLHRLQAIQNQLNIVAAAVKGVERWSPAQDPLFDTLIEAIQSRAGSPYNANLLRARLEYGDLPARLEHTITVLLAADAMIVPEDALQTLARELRTAPQPTGVVERLQAELIARREFAELLRTAVQAERERFRGEQGFQAAMKLSNRLELLTAVPGDRTVFEANLTNYANQAAALPKDYASLETAQPALKPLFEQLRTLPTPADAKALQQALRELAEALCALPAPPTPAQAQLTARVAALAAQDAGAQERFRAAMAGYIRMQTAAVIPAPVANLCLGRAWLQDTLKADPLWASPPANVADVWLAADQLRQLLTAHRAAIICGRYALDPAKRQDAEAELREYAIEVQDLSVACRELDAGTRTALAALLEPMIRHRVTPGAAAAAMVPPPIPTLPPALETAGRAALATVNTGLESDFDLVATQFEKAAARFDALAANLGPVLTALPEDAMFDSKGQPNPEVAARVAPCRTEAHQLLTQTEAMEHVLRNLIFLKLCGTATGQPAAAWDAWQPLHGLLLAFTTTGITARDQISFRFMDEKNTKAKSSVTVDGARTAAAGYRNYAGQLRLAARGQKVACNFDTVMRESRTLGHLEALQKEYELLLPALQNGNAAALEPLRSHAKVAGLAQLAVTERVLETATRAAEGLTPTPGTPAPEAGARLLALEQAWPARPGAAPLDAVTAFRPKLAAAGTATVAAALPGAKDTLQLLDKELEALRAAAQIPVRRRPQRQNQRDRQMDAQGIWVIADTIQNHDARWTTRVQEAELTLSRDVVALCVPPFVQPDAAQHLALDYARLVELRGRQLAAERRRNQGFMLLEGDSGPRLKLPKHIASEFFRARNRKSPEQFRDWSEAYYSELYKAAGK